MEHEELHLVETDARHRCADLYSVQVSHQVQIDKR